jgi:outer membrane protein assembly factor BamB
MAALAAPTLLAPWGRAQSSLPLPEFAGVGGGSVDAIVESGGVVYVGGAFTQAFSQAGRFAVVDDAAGSLLPPIPHVDGTVNDIAADGAGGFYIGGAFSRVGGLPRNNAAHVLGDGRVSKWNPNVTGGAVLALAVAGHEVYLGGGFTSVGGSPRNRLVRVSAATGAVDVGWKFTTTDLVRGIAVGPSQVYVVGNFGFVNDGTVNITRVRAAAFDRTTGVLTAWNPAANGPIYAAAVSSSGADVYVGGDFTQVGGGQHRRLAAVDAVSGAERAAWMSGGSSNDGADGIVHSLVQRGTAVYAGGAFAQVAGVARGHLAAIDAFPAPSAVLPWAPSADGSAVFELAAHGTAIYVAGDFSTLNGSLARRGFAAVDVSGAVQPWDPSAAQPNATEAGLALALDGARVALGGSFPGIGARARNGLAAFDVASGALTPWNPGVGGGAVQAIAADGATIYAGGAFTSVAATARNRAAAIDTAGALLSWNPNLDGAVRALAVTSAGGPVFLGGAFSTANGGTARPFLAQVGAGAGALTAWTPPAPNNAVSALALAGTTLYAGGQFTALGATPRNRLAALDTVSAALDGVWNPSATGTGPAVAVKALSLGATGPLYAAGSFTALQGTPRNRIGAVARAGGGSTGAPTTWNPDAGADVNAVAVVANSTLAVAGAFTSVNGAVPRNRLASFFDFVATGNATPWNPSADAGAAALVATPQRLYAGGAFQALGGRSQPGFAAFCLAPQPSGLTATPLGNNGIQLTWAGSAPQYRVYRALFAGGPFALAGTVAVNSFVDAAADGGVSYFYVVRGLDGCESDPSNEASAVTTGACGGAPYFEGVASMAPVAGPVCGAELRWAAAIALCGAGVHYSVYRDTSPAFVPEASNRIATGVIGASYTDASALASATTYYYVARAAHDSNGREDDNLIRFAFTPSSCTQSAPAAVPFFTVRSGDGANVLNWLKPVAGYDQTVVRVCGPTSGCALAFPSGPTDGDPVTVAGGVPGTPTEFTHGGLTNADLYNYAAFAESGVGLFSTSKPSWGRPATAAGAAKWAFTTGASNLTPAGILPSGQYVAVSNDRAAHAMQAGAGGGPWPVGWTPYALGGPSQGRPTLVSVTIGVATKVAFVSSQDGRVYALDADTGALLWVSPVLGTAIQASPSVTSTAFGGAYDLVLVGTREPAGASRLYALDLSTGGVKWVFDNGGGGNPSQALGIVSGQPLIDHAAARVYFATRRRVPGAADTVWCLAFTDLTANKLWSQNVGDVDGAVTRGAGRLYVGTNNGRVYALDPASGGFAWSPSSFDTGSGQPIKGFVYTALVTSGVYRLFFTTGNQVFALEDSGGAAPALFWPASGISVPGASTPLAVLPRVYVGGDNSRLYSLDGGSTTPPPPAEVVLGDPAVPKVIGRATFDRDAMLLLVGSDQGVTYAVAPFP